MKHLAPLVAALALLFPAAGGASNEDGGGGGPLYTGPYCYWWNVGVSIDSGPNYRYYCGGDGYVWCEVYSSGTHYFLGWN